jgi:hypothetical protein
MPHLLRMREAWVTPPWVFRLTFGTPGVLDHQAALLRSHISTGQDVTNHPDCCEAEA